MNKIYILVQESTVDGEFSVNVTPCATMEVARAKMQKEYDTLRKEGHYSELEEHEDYTTTITENSIDMFDNFNNYSEFLHIEEKEIAR